MLDDLRSNEEWFYPFALWLSTGLRNAEVIGLTWHCVRLDQGELLVSKTLRHGTATHQRLWSGTKTGKARGAAESAGCCGAEAAQEDDAVPGSEHEGWLGVCDPKNPWASV